MVVLTFLANFRDRNFDQNEGDVFLILGIFIIFRLNCGLILATTI